MVVEITPLVRSNALTLYEKQAASVSFTDCLVMACADEYKTNLIFGFDSAFGKTATSVLGWMIKRDKPRPYFNATDLANQIPKTMKGLLE